MARYTHPLLEALYDALPGRHKPALAYYLDQLESELARGAANKQRSAPTVWAVTNNSGCAVAIYANRADADAYGDKTCSPVEMTVRGSK